MRQGQQNRRGRGRGNGQGHQGRKGQNPLTRSYESNGPDVKIRGTPAHIAEKYASLARDAQSSGDPVLAENYLQHAEHYSRIIMAYREQQMGQSAGEFANGSANPPSRQRTGEASDASAEAVSEESAGDGATQPASGQDAQPRSFEDRPQRGSQRDRGRHQSDRQDRGDRQERGDGGYRRGRERQSQAQTHEQPEFLRRSVRRPRRDSEDEGSEVAASATAGSTEDRE